MYRDKLVHLRDLYTGQQGHLKQLLREGRREFLLQWLGEGGGKVHGTVPLSHASFVYTYTLLHD